MFPNTIVIGAGIGGLAAAINLARSGTAVTVLERAPEITEVGAGLQISPNGMRALAALGLDGRLKRRALQARAVVLEDFRQGRQVARLDLGHARNAEYFFVHRADLVAVMRQAALEHNVTFELGVEVTDVEPGELPQVHLSDGSTRQAKFVVCADGIKSIGRRALNGPAKPKFTGQVAWRALVPSDCGDLSEARVTMGPGRHIVRYPLRDGRLMNIVAVEERDDWVAEGWHHKDDPINMQRAFAGFGGPVAALLERAQEVHVWGLFRHPVADLWHKGNVVLLGDAAHPTLPFLAQGANMALEDSIALVRALEAGSLERYKASRYDRVSRIIDTSSKNAKRYHMSPGPLRWAAHRGLTMASKFTPGLMLGAFDWLYGFDPTKDKT